jgi:hypothetical protein
MPTLSVDDLILDQAEYAAVRRDRRADAIALRRLRRVPLGDAVVVEFENDATLAYQAQEMLYVERVGDPAVAAAEIAVYERLLPTARTLTATLLIAIAEPANVRAELNRLDGLHEAIALHIGSTRTEVREIPPPGEGPSEHTVSVHFLAFDLSPAAVDALNAGEPARLVVDLAAYPVTAELTPTLTALLAGDLRSVGSS